MTSRRWMPASCALIGLLLGAASPSLGQTCPITNDETATGQVNTYFPSPAVATVAAGSTTIPITGIGASGPSDIAVGDLLLVTQMQDADLDVTNSGAYGDGSAGDPASGQTALNSAGLYEYVVSQTALTVGAATPTSLSITGGGTGAGTINAYRTATRTATAGQRAYQVIRVSRYRNVTLSGVAALPWNGAIGGVVAIDVAGTTTLTASSIDVTGAGFRGGIGVQSGSATSGGLTDYVRSAAATANGEKAEGIAGTPSGLTGIGATGYPTAVALDLDGDRMMGAPGNAGGGGNDPGAPSQNAGGGGGGNGGVGGRGGNSWSSNLAVGGFGGAALGPSLGRVFMGGGGGAGSRNNSPGIPLASSGSAGGGLVFVRTALLAGTGTITADGASANVAAFIAENDGSGGGGAGGTIVFVAPPAVALTGATILARGGRGSDNDVVVTNDPHGPGGGGGGGAYFVSSAPSGTSSVAGGANGTTNTGAVAFGATSGAVGVTNTASAFDSVPGVQTCFAVTRASILGVRVTPGLVEFSTETQRGTAGFNVYGLTRRGRVRIDDGFVKAEQPNSLGPTKYSIGASTGGSSAIFIEEVETNGRSRMIGPFAVGDARAEAALSRFEDREANRAALRSTTKRPRPAQDPLFAGTLSQRPGPTPPAPPKIAGAFKVSVSEPGVVRIPFAEAQAFGLPSPTTSGLRLTNYGTAVPFSVTHGALVFSAAALETDYTADNVYVFSWGVAPPAPTAALTRSGFELPQGFVRVQENRFYAPFVAQGLDPWIWNFLSADAFHEPLAFDLPRLVPGSGTALVRIGVIGASDHAHHVSATLNGQFIGALDFSGTPGAVLAGSVPRSSLRASDNSLELSYSAGGSTSENPGLVFVDSVDVQATVAPASAEVEHRLAPYSATLPSLASSNYLIVTHPDFAAQAQRVASAKNAEGWRAAVLSTERIYDRFSAGIVEPAAIRELLRATFNQVSTKSVLLVGGDTFDPRNFAGAGLRSFVPSLFAWDGVFGRIPSENRFADVRGDARPEFAIGRLPARNVAEATAMVDKIVRQTSLLQALRGRDTFAADNQAAGDFPFRAHAETVRSLLGSTAPIADVADGIDVARASLLAALGAGAQTTHFFGHAGPSQWADEGLLTAADAASLAGNGKPTVLFTWACEAQWFLNNTPTVSEAMLSTPNGGAVAATGPLGISDPARQRFFADKVYAKVLAGKTLGEALRLAKLEALAQDPGLAPVVEGWVLFGDPALRLPR